ncbi:HAD hydrolase-like protein [Enterococcus dongliensis]|uniref:HAD hydrolase-like protein n=1 Tax=Enterococcus dongliensis TaxID=2559925 RepID=A0AAP5KQQ7_9ENTE|nr:HAD hydrolase-like protein [Enterococcus dongliensis]MDT2596623.1 HAD hydrolase-like protein [Enterococcus dongliensis]MDT2603681.1 HAD hydrolase-like protein [Enterococcus dongliensis]MDT2634391.1 HAD hydrolase-like protein [Enterococcus dongliensis]MDT2637417.1 HAD hydrolase-like protein [Enterococcus dongliensis]MDT2639045.1 HAD hydrolase-like protein [Enterococcus dongliensis]
MKNIVLFDLDGTLTDSSEGILNSICYMLEKKGLVIPDKKTLQSFIGPPLSESLQELYNLSETEAKEAVKLYRDHYAEHGVKQLTVYAGIEAVLAELSSNYFLAIATSKPEYFAKQIIDNIGLARYFSGIFGADLIGERSKKTDVIAYALAELEETSGVMVGDRKFDILGAKENQLKSIGVLYGFGERQEMIKAGADQIVATVDELPAAIKSSF